MSYRKDESVAQKSMISSIAIGILLMATVASAQRLTYHEHVQYLLKTNISTWIQDPIVINNIKAQNDKHTTLTQDDIDRLDKQWRAERKAAEKPLINAVLTNPLSAFLQKTKAQSQGLFSEIFVMDNRGLNVGQSDVTSDYWQGDEAKWQKTYPVGPDALLIGDREFDESSKKFLIQISIPVVDPDNGSPIGAATIGVSLVQMIRLGTVAGKAP